MTSSQWADTVQYNGIDIFGTPQRYVELYREKFETDRDYHSAGGNESMGLRAEPSHHASDHRHLACVLAFLD